MTFNGSTFQAALLAIAITATTATAQIPAPVAPTAAPVVATPAVATPAAAAPAARAPAASKPQWKDLSLPQQVALDPLKSEWDRMEAVRKQKWLEIANRYASMKPDEQQRVHERMRAWLKLTPEERRLARENYTLSKKIGKDQKSAQWEQYQQLPEEEKKKLADAAATKKQVTNLPPKAQPKTIAPIKKNATAVCAAGTVKNPNAAGPACIPAPAIVTPPPTPAPVNPAVPVPNAK